MYKKFYSANKSVFYANLSEIPLDLFCPLYGKIMTNPVINPETTDYRYLIYDAELEDKIDEYLKDLKHYIAVEWYRTYPSQRTQPVSVNIKFLTGATMRVTMVYRLKEIIQESQGIPPELTIFIQNQSNF